MPSLRQRLVYPLESAVIALVFGFFRLLPLDWTSGFAGFIGRHFGRWFVMSKVGRRNLRAAFPEKSEAEIERLMAASWDNLCRTFAEYAQLDRLWDKNPVDPYEHSRIQLSDPQAFLALRDSPHKGIIFTGHCGNWEVLPVAAARFGLPLAIIFRPPNNPRTRELLDKVRRRSMGRLLATNTWGTAAFAKAALEQGEWLGLLIDQYFGKGIDLPFFGRAARTAPTLAKLAQRFDCPVVGAVVERLEGAHFRLHLLPPVDIPRSADGSIDEAGLMAACTQRLEDWVRAHPEQWLWFHRRWR